MWRFANVQMLVILVIVLFQSCSNEHQQDDKKLKDGDTIFYPDTVAFKQSWKMTDSVMLSELFATDTFYNQLGLDTFELTYIPCNCPDWIDIDKRPLECKECSDFYVDPADKSLMFPDDFLVQGNTVRFFGVRIPEMGIPDYKRYMDVKFPAWTMIRYYGYEVVRPYNVWAPRPKIYDELNDTVEVPLTVTFR